MTEVLVQGAKGVKRRRTLEPYMLKVQEVFRREPFDPSRSRRLAIDGVAVSVEPWVIASVETQAGLADGTNDLAELLGQSLALWLKTALDVRSLRREIASGSSNLYEEQAKLMLDSALGATLLQELQKCIDGLVQQGDLEEAKRLSKFRGQMSGLVRELKQVISDSNVSSEAEIEEVSDEEETAPAPAPARAPARAPAPASVPAAVAARLPRESDPEIHTPVRRRRPAPAKPQPAEPVHTSSSYRTQILVALNVVALIALIVLRMPSRGSGKTPAALDAHDFENAAALVAIVARPPALYASVDKQVWSAFSPEQQQQFVDSMGSVLASHGYWGLTLKTSDDRLVGQWFEKGGTRLFEVAPAGQKKPGRESGQYSRFVP
jgi:polyhydroxyalkanoate synthesis regulator phasin